MNTIHKHLTSLSSTFGDEPIDLFICSASFEDRCKSIIDNLGDAVLNRTIVAYNVCVMSLVRDNLNYISRALVSRVGMQKHFELEVDSSQPIRTADNIVEAVRYVIGKEAQRFVIDTTTFTRESLLILVRFLRAVLKPIDTVDFLYAPAKEYSLGDVGAQKWLSKGIREIRSVLGYPGDLLPSRHNHLIILVGFEDERALSLIRECEPSLISLGIADGLEMDTRRHQATNERKLARIKSIVGDSTTEFVFKGYNVEATREVIWRQVKRMPGYNTIIAPMNTKMSTLAAAALALENAQIQICYGQPDLYNHSNYSAPNTDFYLFHLPGIPYRPVQSC